MGYDEKYRALYGEQTIVWMEAGGFVEVYGATDNDPQMCACAEIHLTVTRRNSNQPNSPYMAGFPSHASKKYAELLIQKGFTIVLVTQTTPPPHVIRKVTQILSPGTNLSMDTNAVLCSILLDYRNGGSECYASLVWFDTNVGQLHIERIHDNQSVASTLMSGCAADKTYTMLRERMQVIRPNEVIVCSVCPPLDIEPAVLKHALGLSHTLVHLTTKEKVPAVAWEKVASFFPHVHSAYGTVAECLGLEACDAPTVQAMLALLDFLQDHNPSYVRHLGIPALPSCDVTHMATYNSLYEKLDIFGASDSLAKRLNKTKTGMGSRLWVRQLCNPLVDADAIRARHRKVAVLMATHPHVRSLLQIGDIERLYRRFSVGRLQPADLTKLKTANTNVLELHRYLKCNSNEGNEFPMDDATWNAYEELVTKLEETFDLDKCANVGAHFTFGFGSQHGNTLPSLFRPGQVAELDLLANGWEAHFSLFTRLLNAANECFDRPYLNLKCHDKDGYFLETTKTRMRIVQAKYPDWQYNFSSTTAKCRPPGFSERSSALQELAIQIHEVCLKNYSAVLDELHNKYHASAIRPVCEWVATVDVAASHALVATINNYCRPVVCDGPSFVRATQLRHPVIEQLVQENQQVAYVPNDANLNSARSHLLFGVNSSGKSSYLKAIAIAVLIAQSGAFVSSESFEIAPYHKLFIRAGNTDDMFRNHSSFVKEMVESKVIWNEATDVRSLVLADELCASTEHCDAVKIVATIVSALAQRGVSFLFASHLHELNSHDWVKAHSSIKTIHMRVDYDSDGGLVFDRRLCDGMPATQQYGVHVAKRIFRNAEFSEMIDQKLAIRRSRYNRKIAHSQCQLCGYTQTTKTMQPLETHHISFQCDADKKGFHEHVHKNRASNLVVLCKNCHVNVHQKKVGIEGFVLHEDGRRLVATQEPSAVSS